MPEFMMEYQEPILGPDAWLEDHLLFVGTTEEATEYAKERSIECTRNRGLLIRVRAVRKPLAIPTVPFRNPTQRRR